MIGLGGDFDAYSASVLGNVKVAAAYVGSQPLTACPNFHREACVALGFCGRGRVADQRDQFKPQRDLSKIVTSPLNSLTVPSMNKILA